MVSSVGVICADIATKGVRNDVMLATLMSNMFSILSKCSGQYNILILDGKKTRFKMTGIARWYDK